MPYPEGHRVETRGKIVSCARALFNRHGYHGVSIDQVMAEAGLTRGGFYTYFSNKEELYAEAITRILVEHPTENWDGVEVMEDGNVVARKVVEAYLGDHHFNDIEGTCPLIAQPNDVARGGASLRAAYEQVLRAMLSIFAGQAPDGKRAPQQRAKAIAALCVGGMVLARSLNDDDLGDEIRAAAMQLALEEGGWEPH